MQQNHRIYRLTEHKCKSQALLYGLSLEGMVGWIIAGLPWDCIHGVSNFFCGILIVPVISALRFAEERFARLTE